MEILSDNLFKERFRNFVSHFCEFAEEQLKAHTEYMRNEELGSTRTTERVANCVDCLEVVPGIRVVEWIARSSATEKLYKKAKKVTEAFLYNSGELEQDPDQLRRALLMDTAIELLDKFQHVFYMVSRKNSKLLIQYLAEDAWDRIVNYIDENGFKLTLAACKSQHAENVQILTRAVVKGKSRDKRKQFDSISGYKIDLEIWPSNSSDSGLDFGEPEPLLISIDSSAIYSSEGMGLIVSPNPSHQYYRKKDLFGVKPVNRLYRQAFRWEIKELQEPQNKGNYVLRSLKDPFFIRDVLTKSIKTEVIAQPFIDPPTRLLVNINLEIKCPDIYIRSEELHQRIASNKTVILVGNRLSGKVQFLKQHFKDYDKFYHHIIRIRGSTLVDAGFCAELERIATKELHTSVAESSRSSWQKILEEILAKLAKTGRVTTFVFENFDSPRVMAERIGGVLGNPKFKIIFCVDEHNELATGNRSSDVVLEFGVLTLPQFQNGLLRSINAELNERNCTAIQAIYNVFKWYPVSLDVFVQAVVKKYDFETRTVMISDESCGLSGMLKKVGLPNADGVSSRDLPLDVLLNLKLKTSRLNSRPELECLLYFISLANKYTPRIPVLILYGMGRELGFPKKELKELKDASFIIWEESTGGVANSSMAIATNPLYHEPILEMLAKAENKPLRRAVFATALGQIEPFLELFQNCKRKERKLIAPIVDGVWNEYVADAEDEEGVQRFHHLQPVVEEFIGRLDCDCGLIPQKESMY